MAPPAKKRKTQQPSELTFDPDARQEYLTGFHKRKLQRTKHAQEEAQKRDREDRVRERRELREQRKADLQKHVSEVNAILKKAVAGDSDEEGHEGEVDGGADGAESGLDVWEGFKEDPPDVNGMDEYVDEDKYTTVTIKELDDVRDFESASEDESKDDAGVVNGRSRRDGDEGNRAKSTPNKTKFPPKKPKKKKFRYESKAERHTERKKQKLKSSAAAKARRGQ